MDDGSSAWAFAFLILLVISLTLTRNRPPRTWGSTLLHRVAVLLYIPAVIAMLPWIGGPHYLVVDAILVGIIALWAIDRYRTGGLEVPGLADRREIGEMVRRKGRRGE